MNHLDEESWGLGLGRDYHDMKALASSWRDCWDFLDLDVISLLDFDLLLGSHSVSDSIQGTVSEVTRAMCWVQNTNTSLEATFPDFREL